MRPLKSALILCDGNKKLVAEKFGVSEKTAIRWLEHYGLYDKRANFGPKLSTKKANQIRVRHQKGEDLKSLAETYGITLSAVYRVVKYETHKTKDFASVNVVYNPSSSSVGGK